MKKILFIEFGDNEYNKNIIEILQDHVDIDVHVYDIFAENNKKEINDSKYNALIIG
jgi:hypothetical protein